MDTTLTIDYIELLLARLSSISALRMKAEENTATPVYLQVKDKYYILP